MGQVVANLTTMGPEQFLLVLVFLGSYAFVLGEFASARGRLVAVATAMLAATGFAALSSPWEAGAILVAFAAVGMGLFAGAAWTLWVVATWRDRGTRRARLEPVECARPGVGTGPLLARLWARLRFV